MGDRATIILTDKEKTVSPAIYLHWYGSQAKQFINEAIELMESRGDDISYSTARLIGIIHNHIEGNISLGLTELSNEDKEAVKNNNEKHIKKEIANWMDNGVFIWNTSTNTITNLKG